MRALATNAFEVTMVRIRHCCAADSIASLPAVKFRLTGTLPAIDTPMLTSDPATDAGSSTPTISSAPQFRRVQRDSNRLAVSALPYVSSRPVESAMAKRDQF